MADKVTGKRLADPGRRLGFRIAHGLYSVKLMHRERVPAKGSVILVANHTSFLDGPIIFVLAPRTVRFLVKRSYFSSAWGALLKAMGQIPIDQDSGDREALATARTVLADGGALGVFPEGHRGRGAVEAAQQGAAWLALQSGAPVVPVAVLGTRGVGGKDSWPKPRGRICVVFGEPFELQFAKGVPGREKLRLATEQLREQLAGHVQQAVAETGMPLPPAP